MIRVMFLGGPRNAFVLVSEPSADETITAHVDGIDHVYGKGANLPQGVKSRLAPQAFAFEVYGYQGPDRAAVEALGRDFPVHEATA